MCWSSLLTTLSPRRGAGETQTAWNSESVLRGESRIVDSSVSESCSVCRIVPRSLLHRGEGLSLRHGMCLGLSENSRVEEGGAGMSGESGVGNGSEGGRVSSTSYDCIDCRLNLMKR